MMEILCFGVARDIIGADQLVIKDHTPITSVKELRIYLEKEYTAFSDLSGYMIAVNESYVSDDQHIDPADEVAIIPPVSGG